MKKTAIILTVLLAAIAILFTACGMKNDKTPDLTTTMPATTKAPVTTTEKTSLLTTEHNSSVSDGAPESTSQDSALGNAIEDAADGAARAGERIADGVREAESRNNAR